MKINKNNYEIYFIDYYDGKLNSDEETLLFSFLNNNAELKEEFENFNNFTFEPEKIEYPKKSNIKKFDLTQKITSSNFEEFCVANVEGDLTSEKQEELNHFLETNSEYQKEASLYQNLKLIPDVHITYPKKRSLKRTTNFRKKLFYYSYAAAASIILFLLLNNLWKNQNHPDPVLVNTINNEETQNSKENEIEIVENQIVKSNELILKEKSQAKNNTVKEYHDNTNNIAEKSIIDIPSDNQPEKIILKKLNPVRIFEVKSITNSSPTQDEMIYAALGQPLLPENKEKIITKFRIEKPSLYVAANAGINGINKLLGTNMSLEKKYDDEGNYTALAFNSKLLSFSKAVDK